MAWELFTKEDVEIEFGVPSDNLVDAHYNQAIAIAEDWMDKKISGTATYTDEAHDGDGTDTLFVDHPPIVSVSDLSVDGSTQGNTTYKVYKTHVRIKTISPTEVEAALWGREAVFPVGRQNVTITYVGGTATADVTEMVKTGLKMIVAQLALMKERGGSDASMALDFAQARQGEDTVVPSEMSIERIARRFFGRRVRAF